MIIIEIKNNENLERALKTLKSKIIKNKQNQLLLKKKEYTKPSVVKRTAKLKAIFLERKKKQLD